MTEREAVRALSAAGESDEVDARREVESRLRHHLIRERDERFVDPQIRQRQALIRDRVVIGTRREQKPAVLFRGGHELLRQVSSVAAKTRENDDQSRHLGRLCRHRIRHEEEPRPLIPCEAVNERGLVRGACGLPACVERGSGVNRGRANEEPDHETERER